MSKAFYDRVSSTAPALLRRWESAAGMGFRTDTSGARRAVEVWSTTCIVTNFGRFRGDKECSGHGAGGAAGRWADTDRVCLVCPSNPQLRGPSKFPYFPRGGPVPPSPPAGSQADWQPLGYVNSWGGMDVGSGMLYATSVVDGLVHLHGGWRLAAEIAALDLVRDDEKCPVGHAVETVDMPPPESDGSGAVWLKPFDAIVHVTPPFYEHHPSPERWLRRCYAAAFRVAFSGDSSTVAALPLIGNGGRGFPTDKAVEIAASACAGWLDEEAGRAEGEGERTVAFGVPDTKVAEALVRVLDRECNAGADSNADLDGVRS